jgi:hypothetical protein
MTLSNPWEMLKCGDLENGLRLLHDAYLRKPSASQILSLGVAYIWAKRYEEAFSHFQRSMLAYRNTMSSFYGMAGAAKWCLNEPDAAVKEWVSGLSAEYADGAGGVALPLLLFAASILRPKVFSTTDAVRLLEEKARDPRIEFWPGPLAEFVLGRTDETMALSECVGFNTAGSRTYVWQLRFYIGVLELRRGKDANFKYAMASAADISGPQWSDENVFTRRLWREEFFIARHETTGR